NSSVFGFSTWGERGPSPPPPPGPGTVGWGFWIRSGIQVIVSLFSSTLHNLRKWQLRKVLNGLGSADHFQALSDNVCIKEVAQIKLDLFVRAVHQDVIPLRRMHGRAEFFDAAAPHRRSGARWR